MFNVLLLIQVKVVIKPMYEHKYLFSLIDGIINSILSIYYKKKESCVLRYEETMFYSIRYNRLNQQDWEIPSIFVPQIHGKIRMHGFLFK